MLRLVMILVVACWLTGGAKSAAAGERVALVLANGAYAHAPQLPNATRDGAAVAEALRNVGFTVFDGIDLDLAATRDLVRRFAYALESADLGLFYYAGHGLQVAGENYIVPVDATLEHEIDLSFEALSIGQVTNLLERKERTAIVILDACRDNPFAPKLSRSMGGSRGLGAGLAEISPGLGMLVVFATDPGKVAFDGQGDHSPFTAALLRHLDTPGLEVRQLMTRVRRDVLDATGGEQRPWDNSSLLSDVYLVPAAATPAADAAGPSAPASTTQPTVSFTDEQRYWDGVQQITDSKLKAEALDGYLDQFPSGRFASLARLQRKSLIATAEQPAATSGAPVQTAALPPDEKSLPRVLTPSTGTDTTTPETPAVPVETPAERAERELGLDRDGRREVQALLNRAGYPVGTPDGNLGRRSRTAIAAFQRSARLDATGFLTGPTIDKLRVAPAVAVTTPGPPAGSDATPPRTNRTAPSEARAAAEPAPGAMVECRSPSDPAWVDFRLITFADCKRIGGRWNLP